MTVNIKEEARKGMTPAHKHELRGVESTRPERVFTPAVDIFETDKAITVVADMPGVGKDGLNIDVRDDTLTLTGTVAPAESRNERVLLREYETGSFYRQFRLSNTIDQSKIDATLENGALRLTLPKAEASRPRKIEIKTR
jgi:HSP20 family protein